MEASGHQRSSSHHMITWWQSVALRRSHRDHIARAHARDEELIGRVRDERATWMERAHAALGTARVPDCHVGSGAADELHHD
jgi:hypothetical protein